MRHINAQVSEEFYQKYLQLKVNCALFTNEKTVGALIMLGEQNQKQLTEIAKILKLEPVKTGGKENDSTTKSGN